MFGSSKKNRRKKSPKQRKKQRRQTLSCWLRRAALVGGLAVVAIGIPALIFLGYDHLMESDYFALTYVDVEGLDHLEEEELLAATEGLAGEHILDVRSDRLEQAISGLGFVQTAEVDRRFPNRLHIHIEEHEPVAIVVDDGFWLVNTGGEPFYELDTMTRNDQLWELPLISGLTRATLEQDEGLRRFGSALRVWQWYEELQLDEKQPVSEVHVDEMLGISLIVGETGTEVRLGQGNFRKRLEKYADVQASLIRRGVDAAYVLVDHEGDLNRVTVGLRDEPMDGEERTVNHSDQGQ